MSVLELWLLVGLYSGINHCYKALWLWKMRIQCYSNRNWIPLTAGRLLVCFCSPSLSSGNFHAVNWGIDLGPTMFVLSSVYHHRRKLEQEFVHIWHNTKECDQWLQHSVLFLKEYWNAWGIVVLLFKHFF